jgi:nucleotide-binding universal stress UspA family protein
MKTILVATDFSNAAHNAVVYAAQLANAFNARLILFSAYEQARVPVSEIPVLTMEEMEVRVQRQLEDEKQFLELPDKLNIETISRQGYAARCILEVVDEQQAEIVVAGMKNEDVFIRQVFGSTVTALAQKLSVPLLVVPEDAMFFNITSIALAYEGDIAPDSNPHLLDILREIGERFHSRLYLVRVAQNKFQATYEMLNRPFRLNRMVRTLDPQYKCIAGNDIAKFLHNYVSNYNISLLALLPHKHSSFEKWFIKSTTRTMIFESPVPLLIVPEKQVKQTAEISSVKANNK